MHRNDDDIIALWPMLNPQNAGTIFRNCLIGSRPAGVAWVRLDPIRRADRRFNPVDSDLAYADRFLGVLGEADHPSSAAVLGDFRIEELMAQRLEALERDPTTYPVQPGDLMHASLSCNQPCSSKKQNWTLWMNNETRNWTWSMPLTYSSSLLSAEWIEEAPYEGGILPLANFGTAHFPGANLANLTSPAVTSANAIQMQDPWGQWANPSAASVPNFNVCWGFET